MRGGKYQFAGFVFPCSTPCIRHFYAMVNAVAYQMRERVNGRMDKKNVPADKRKVILSKLDANAAKVIAEVDKVGADGTVTKDEAKQVHTLARSLREEAKREHAKQSQK